MPLGMQLTINPCRSIGYHRVVNNSRHALQISCRAGGARSRDALPNARRRSPPPERQQESKGSSPDYQGPTDAEVWIARLQRLPPTSRSVALQQLLRIEEEGAFAGLVGGSPNVGADTDENTDTAAVSTAPATTGDGRKALDERNRRQATDLVSSVTRWRRRLAWVLNNLPKPTNLDKMDAPLRLLLLMGSYEVLELGVAPHAVNEYVNLAKAVMHEGCGKVANGVLRTLLRCVDDGQIPRPPKPAPDCSVGTLADAMGVATSHPTWLVKKWLTEFGKKDTMALLQHDNKRPRYSIRLVGNNTPAQLIQQLEQKVNVVQNNSTSDNTTTPSSPATLSNQQVITAYPSKYLPNEFLVIESGLQAVLSAGMLTKGQAQVQDEAAGLVVAMLDPQAGEKILDCCAAPGGKTLFAAARMGAQGRIVALDVSTARLRAVAATARAQGIINRDSFKKISSSKNGNADGLSNIIDTSEAAPTFPFPTTGAEDEFLQCVPQDARQFCGNSAAAEEFFDRVLVDAPCSGTGVLVKRADLRWRRQPEDFSVLCNLQSQLLSAAAQVVRPGGLLVYSTCSLESEENETIISEFLSNDPLGSEFSVEPPPESAAIPAECLSEQGMLRMLPHVHGTDGAFAARLRRKE
jgi:16S rRNA (cytosine967-C5)-methyltransferase